MKQKMMEYKAHMEEKYKKGNRLESEMSAFSNGDNDSPTKLPDIGGRNQG